MELSAHYTHRLGKLLYEDRQHLLSLEDDFDGEGSPGYTREVIEKAENFLFDVVHYMDKVYGVECPLPVGLCPGPNGSIDVHWKLRDCEVFVCIPRAKNISNYYCDDVGGNNTAKGIINLFKPIIFFAPLLREEALRHA